MAITDLGKPELVLSITVVIINHADDFTRISNSYTIGWNVLHNNTARTNYTVIADGNTRTHCHTCAKPNIISHGNWCKSLIPRQAPCRICRVYRSNKCAVGTNQYIVAKCNYSTIHQFAVIIREKIMS